MMNQFVRIAAAGVLGAVAIVSTSGAFAQDAAPAPTSAMDHGDRDGAAWRERMQAHRMEKIQALRAALQLRPDQEGAFQTFTQSMTSERPMDERRMGHHPMDGRHEGDAAMAAMTTPQRLDMRLSRMDQREARVRQHAAATKQFYAALSPEQQKAFDGLMALGEHKHGFGGRHGERDAG